MYYYLVDKIGDGSQDNPFRPSIPNATLFVGNIIGDGTKFLIASNIQLTNQIEITDLNVFCISYGLSMNDVLTWNVGDAP